MQASFQAEIWYWRGPSPWFFATVPPDVCAHIHELSAEVSYGWGMIPAIVRIGRTDYPTALWPKDGGYIVPIKTLVRRAEEIDEGDEITVGLTIGE
ncbi:MAG: DUF1905 domain-containing protein [Nakamurella sp.]